MNRAPKSLSRRLAAALLAVLCVVAARPAAAEVIRISGTGGAIGTIRLVAEAFRRVRPDVQVQILPSMGSIGAVKAVLAGRLDIGLSYRQLTREETDRDAVETMYARTPFVFGVTRNVKSGGLTKADVATIYAGTRNRWDDGSRIRVVVRPRGESDIEILKGMSREMDAAVESAMRREGMIVAMTDQDAADAIEKVPNAFGATTLALVVSEKRAIRVLALDGVVPSGRAVEDGTYPYHKTFRMVTKREPPAAVRRFIDFVRSPAAAAILAMNGQVPVR